MALSSIGTKPPSRLAAKRGHKVSRLVRSDRLTAIGLRHLCTPPSESAAGIRGSRDSLGTDHIASTIRGESVCPQSGHRQVALTTRALVGEQLCELRCT